MRQFPWFDLLAILVIAAVGRALLLASGAVSFHSDEAIVALMARHINQGARPVFFYGQAYMGSLDAWLIAIGFRLLGESVMSIRVVQSVLYLLVVATAYLAAWQLSGKRIVAAVAGLLLAVPAVNTMLYTTATLGGYNETLLLGNLMLILGHALVSRQMRFGWRWAGLGLAAGLGWWTNGLIVVYALPVGLVLLVSWIRQRISVGTVAPGIGLALLFFVAGSAPWWVFDFTHQHAALSTYLTNRQSGEFEGIGIPYVPPPQRALGLILIGLPTLIGLRFPWSSTYFLIPAGVLVALVYGVAVYRFSRRPDPLTAYGRLLVAGLLLIFCILFIASTFGADPTGRYFLPLVLPLAIIVGTLTDELAQWAGSASGWKRGLAAVPAALIVLYHVLGQVAAIQSPTGVTTQFDLISHIPNDHDDEAIAFLLANDLRYGHTNYWVAFRLAFLSGEALQYSASLPYKADLSYNPADKRYRPYVDATAAAARIAYITTKLPALDEQIEAALQAQGIAYDIATIGEYRIYHDFSENPPLMIFGM
ncbi:MAG TPA: glycosyltransferase family 39 protein [Spirillospora sp.]|nr:glycosyltransferase family 39 protein [Spirillospora sp.]